MNNSISKKTGKGLGKGLDALIPRRITETDAVMGSVAGSGQDSLNSDNAVLDKLLILDPADIRPNPKQPRKTFNEEALSELADSIRNDGVQEPLIVRRVGDHYEIVCGERRCRAAVMAGLDRVPVICREVSDRDMLKYGLIENIQREDLNAIELALAYRELMREYGWTQEQLSQEVGKKRATVTNIMRLLQLPESLQMQVAEGILSMGHARAVLSVPVVADQISLARKISEKGLSVRQAEQLASRHSEKKPRAARHGGEKNPHISQLEDALRRGLGAKVNVRQQDENRGTIEICYFSLDELDRLLKHMIRQ